MSDSLVIAILVLGALIAAATAFFSERADYTNALIFLCMALVVLRTGR